MSKLKGNLNDSDFILTAFTDILKKVIDIENENEDEREDLLLEIENVDIIFNKQRIVLSMGTHK